jgi:hypothetical protein
MKVRVVLASLLFTAAYAAPLSSPQLRVREFIGEDTQGIELAGQLRGFPKSDPGVSARANSFSQRSLRHAFETSVSP